MCAIKKISFGSEKLAGFLSSVNNGYQQNNNPKTPPLMQPQPDKNSKRFVYVSSAVALASLGVAGVALHKNLKSTKNLKKTFSDIAKKLDN